MTCIALYPWSAENVTKMMLIKSNDNKYIIFKAMLYLSVTFYNKFKFVLANIYENQSGIIFLQLATVQNTEIFNLQKSSQ